MTVDANDATDPSRDSSSGYRWLSTYKYYLYAAVALGSVSTVRGALSGSELDESLRANSSLVFDLFLLPIGLDIAGIGLFVFAIYSLGRMGEPWVRNLHLWIHGTAVIFILWPLMISTVDDTFGVGFIFGEPLSVQLASYLLLVVDFKLYAIVPWEYLFQTFSHEDQMGFLVADPAFMLISRGIDLLGACLPAIWYVLWANVLGVSKRHAFLGKAAWTTLAVVLCIGMFLWVPGLILEPEGGRFIVGLFGVDVLSAALERSLKGLGIVLLIWIGGLLLARVVFRSS